jgi:uncharacterized protein involved in outer membrane biogenesis
MRAGRIVAIVVGLVVVAIVAAVVVLKSIDFNQYKTLIADEARKATGRELAIAGDIELEVSFSPSLAVAGVSFANAPWGSAPAMATVERFEAQVDVMPLFGGEVRVRRLVLDGADILLETDKEGRGNWLMAGQEAEEPAPAEEAAGELTIPTFDRVVVRDATVTYRDGASGEEIKLRLDHLDASAPDLASPLAIDLAGSYNELAFTAGGEIGSTEALLGGGAVPVKLAAETAGAKLRIEGQVGSPESGAIAVAIDIEGQSLADLEPLTGRSLPDVGAYRLSADLSMPPDELVLSNLEVNLGKSDLEGGIRIAFSYPLLVEATR